MNSVERRGVLIDLCRDCKGVFLDRGELDKLLDAAEAEQSPLATEAEPLRHRPDRYEDDDDDDHRGWGDDHRRRRRRGGLLGDFFDFD